MDLGQDYMVQNHGCQARDVNPDTHLPSGAMQLQDDCTSSSSSSANGSFVEDVDVVLTSQQLLLALPNEVLECILCHTDIPSLCAVSETCWRLHNVQSSDKVWNAAFFRRYPRLAASTHQAELDLALSQVERNWRRLAAWRSSLGVLVCHMLDQMGDKYYSVGGLPDPAMQQMCELVAEHGTLLVKDELLEILDSELVDSREYISRRYYARMLYRELHRDLVLLPLFRQFMRRPTHHMNIPEALHLIDLWVAPEKRRRDDSELKCHYMRIANMSLAQLRTSRPDHPLAGWSACKSDPFGQTLWADQDVPAVFDAVNAVLYDQLALLGDNDGKPRHGYPAVAHQLFCDHDTGTPAVLSALYATVTGMLGVNVHPVQFPGNCLLLWPKLAGTDYVFVDVMRAGLRQTREEIMRNPYLRLRNVDTHWFEPIPRQQMVHRLVVGTAQSARSPHLTDADLLSLDALAVWSESDCRLEYPCLYGLSQVYGGIRPMYIHRLIGEFLRSAGPSMSEQEREGLQDSMELMSQRYEQILQELKHHQEVVCLRRNAVPVQRRCRVGDIVRHRKYSYLAAVTGWTSQCHASESWIEQMGVDRLPRGRHQPFFHLLVEDGSNRYAADENVELADEPCPIGHREIGRYFVRYDGRRYVPVAALAQRYPDPGETDASDEAEPAGAAGGEQEPAGAAGGEPGASGAAPGPVGALPTLVEEADETEEVVLEEGEPLESGGGGVALGDGR
ncbi:F-box only protein 21-like [Pollicipes pollicipes]|uniref:F-box only protein 21-like n=1 Tax=Pollicipes pollicipes TaxID=41117 RepID=UPI001884AF10|nr:F-box only protein 21-like [Pollicipes pollicipes]